MSAARSLTRQHKAGLLKRTTKAYDKGGVHGWFGANFDGITAEFSIAQVLKAEKLLLWRLDAELVEIWRKVGCLRRRQRSEMYVTETNKLTNSICHDRLRGS